MRDDKGKDVATMLGLLDHQGEVSPELTVIPINNSLALNRAGKYVLVIKFEDAIAKAVTERCVPFEVFDQ